MELGGTKKKSMLQKGVEKGKAIAGMMSNEEVMRRVGGSTLFYVLCCV